MAEDFDDIYFSVEGGLAETREVFHKGCGLPERWAGRRHFVIGETGFGTGLNFLATWKLFAETADPGARLTFISIEKFPLDTQQLTQGLAPWTELQAGSEQLIAKWPDRVKGFHLLEFEQVDLILIHDDILPALEELDARVDAWFLDGFSPAKNPDMWSAEVMARLAELSRPGARLGTFTVAGAVRRALSEAGFEPEKKDGFGKKRQRLEARLPGTYQEPDIDCRPVILGAGIAGASIVRSFLRRGLTPVIIDPNDGTAASGNPAAIIKPRLDLQDKPESRFFLSAFLHAVQIYEHLAFIYHRGVVHLEDTRGSVERWKKLARQRALPASHMELMRDLDNENGVLARPLQHIHIRFKQGLVIDPRRTRGSFIYGSDCRTGQGHHLSEQPDQDISVRDKDDAEIAEATDVFICIGAGVRDLDIGIDLPTRYSRGQLSWADTGVTGTITYGGYAIPLEQGTLLGATHDRADFDTQNIYDARPKSDHDNLQKFKDHLGLPAQLADKSSRVSIRVNMPDTLPLIQPVAPNVSLLTGLGSRGFVFAPLLAEAVVARALGEPSPIARSVWDRFGPRTSKPAK